MINTYLMAKQTYELMFKPSHFIYHVATCNRHTFMHTEKMTVQNVTVPYLYVNLKSAIYYLLLAVSSTTIKHSYASVNPIILRSYVSLDMHTPVYW